MTTFEAFKDRYVEATAGELWATEVFHHCNMLWRVSLFCQKKRKLSLWGFGKLRGLLACSFHFWENILFIVGSVWAGTVLGLFSRQGDFPLLPLSVLGSLRRVVCRRNSPLLAEGAIFTCFYS